MKVRHKRIAFIALGLSSVAVAAFFVLSAFESNLVFFFSPSQVVGKEVPVGESFRIGGLVAKGSLKRDLDGLTSHFTVTDTVKSIPVVYQGILPDLFKEGRGCVAQGRMRADGMFYADQVLAKHDENYMAPEAAYSIEKAKQSANEAATTLID